MGFNWQILYKQNFEFSIAALGWNCEEFTPKCCILQSFLILFLCCVELDTNELLKILL